MNINQAFLGAIRTRPAGRQLAGRMSRTAGDNRTVAGRTAGAGAAVAVELAADQ